GPNESKANGECSVYSAHYMKPPAKESTQNREKAIDSNVQELSTAISNVELDSEQPKRQREKGPKSSKITDVPRVKTNSKPFMEPPKVRAHQDNVIQRKETIRPFFISHPSKMLDQNGLEVVISEFNPTQVFSMSSDSGLFKCFLRD